MDRRSLNPFSPYNKFIFLNDYVITFDSTFMSLNDIKGLYETTKSAFVCYQKARACFQRKVWSKFKLFRVSSRAPSWSYRLLHNVHSSFWSSTPDYDLYISLVCGIFLNVNLTYVTKEAVSEEKVSLFWYFWTVDRKIWFVFKKILLSYSPPHLLLFVSQWY